jgi:hypothetical protein
MCGRDDYFLAAGTSASALVGMVVTRPVVPVAWPAATAAGACEAGGTARWTMHWSSKNYTRVDLPSGQLVKNRHYTQNPRRQVEIR